ncbi:MAG: hypothetical protein HKN82_09485 [Akkermansiaceae bacterium]|nr:hypothetical protein [Akkermansiaceae bacterium]NNM31219.1 hypothetical protein [Akkermansiaceae bacterium]
MEAIFGVLIFLCIAVVIVSAVFMGFFQPLWGIIDVAVSREHTSGTKAAVILLTLLLLGPIMTFFYACFGTRSPALKRSTIAASVALLVSAVAAVGLSAVHPGMRNDLGREPGEAQSTSAATDDSIPAGRP